MKYQVIEKKDHLLINISGDSRKNEPLVVKRLLSPCLIKKSVRVIVDLRGLARCKPVTLVGVLNSIKKEVELLKGILKVRSLNSELASYFKENRLDRLFDLCEDDTGDFHHVRRNHNDG